MASGTINGTGSCLAARLEWSSTPGNGGSTVTVTLYAVNQGGHHWSANAKPSCSITIDGQTFSGTSGALATSTGGTAKMYSASKWIAYTGNKSINISGSVNSTSIGLRCGTHGAVGNRSASGTITLDKVGFVPSFSGNVKLDGNSSEFTVAENRTSCTVTWDKATSYNGSCKYHLYYSINDGAWTYLTEINNINTTSYTYTFGNHNPGTNFRVAVDAGNDAGWAGRKVSPKLHLNKLTPPTIGDVGVFNPYVNSTLTVPLSGGSQWLTEETFIRCANIHVDGNYKYPGDSSKLTDRNTSISIPTTAANIAADLGTNSYSSSTRFTIVAWTQNARGTRSSYVSKAFTVNLNSDGGATPTLAAPILTGGWSEAGASFCFIAGVSTLTVTSGLASLRRAPSGTTLSYKIELLGHPTVNASTASFSNLTAGNKTLRIVVSDSRGLSASVTQTVKVQAYSSPRITNLKVVRLENPNTSARVTYNLTYSPIENSSGIIKNSIQTQQYITDPGVSGFSLDSIGNQQYQPEVNVYVDAFNNMIITGLDTDTAYTVKLRISDKVEPTSYVTSFVTVPTVNIGLALRKNQVGIGCAPASGYALDVRGNARYQNSVTFDKGLRILLNDDAGDHISTLQCDSNDYLIVSNGLRTLGSLQTGGRLKVGSCSQTSIVDAGITVQDVRYADITPNSITKAANFYFTNKDTPTGSYFSLLHVKGWDDSSQYQAWQLGASASNGQDEKNGLWFRQGYDEFNSWQRIELDYFHHLALEKGISTGWVGILQFNINLGYLNSPCEIWIVQRGTGTDITKISLNFNAGATADPNVGDAHFVRLQGSAECKLVKTATSTYVLYVKKTESYDEVTVLKFYAGKYFYDVCTVIKSQYYKIDDPGGRALPV